MPEQEKGCEGRSCLGSRCHTKHNTQPALEGLRRDRARLGREPSIGPSHPQNRTGLGTGSGLFPPSAPPEGRAGVGRTSEEQSISMSPVLQEVPSQEPITRRDRPPAP